MVNTMKTYITFGQAHEHDINGKIITHKNVAIIDGPDAVTNRESAFKLFGPKFCFEYPESFWDEKEKLKYYYDFQGYVNVTEDIPNDQE